VLGWILRLLLLLIVIRLLWRFIAGIIQGLSGPPAGRPRSTADVASRAVPLVRDPVCGTFVVKAKALTSHAAGETQYFCSEDCRDQWLRRTAGRETA
jgi:YHS domain-containing protein